MKRRQFIGSWSAASVVFGTSGCGGGASAESPSAQVPSPTPPPSTAPAPGPVPAPVPPPAPGPISNPLTPLGVSFTLSASSPGIEIPFSIGHAFRQQQVPRGADLFADVDAFQCRIKNRWPDGSVKFALLSGRVIFGESIVRSVALSIGALTAVESSPVTLADLRATGATVSIQFGDIGTATWNGQGWNTPLMSPVTGPQMSSWIFRQPLGNDPHLVAWLEVRCYRGSEVEVLAWLENGYVNVPNPGPRSALVTLQLGTAQRFAQNVTMLNHQRCVLASGEQISHWLTDNRASWPRHDVAYLMSTRLVPNYCGRTPASSPLFSRLPASYVPLAQASFPTEMGSAGYDPSIGVLPEWDAAYFTTGADKRSLTGVLISACAAGRYGTHFRDENTQRPIRLSSYPNLALGSGTGVTSAGTSSRGVYTPAANGGSPPRYASSHHPSIGYLAYLLSGWHYFLEECQFVAALNFLKQSDTSRQGSKGIFESAAGANTTRGAAWALRTLAQAASITPDDDAIRDEWVASVGYNIEYYHARYVSKLSNPLGLVQPYDNYSGGSGPWMGAVWMDDFFTAALGHLKDLAVTASPLTSRLAELLTWKCRSVVGRLGSTSALEFAFPYAAQYTVMYSPSSNPDWSGPGPWYATWGDVARAMGVPLAGATGSPLVSGYPTEPTSYWGNLMPALAAAVDHGASGSAEAWARLQSAVNFGQLTSGFDGQPVWGVTPR